MHEWVNINIVHHFINEVLLFIQKKNVYSKLIVCV